MGTYRTNLSFARGEIAPPLHARVDLPDYLMGLETCRNGIIERQGGWANRPGTSYVCEVKDSSVGARLIPFVFNSAQTYVLEFGNLYMRVVKDGAQVRESTKTITNISQASPGRVTAGTHGYATGDEVHIAAVVGMTQVNGRNFKITVIDADNFDLYENDGTTAFNTSGFTAYSSGGTSARVYQITTPYTSADVATLDAKAQSADIIVITHPNYAPRELSRTADTAWTLATITFTPTQVAPHGVTATVGAAGGAQIRYRVTAINDDTGEESLPARGATQAISAISQANPAVVTYVGADNFANDDEIYIEGVVGMTEVNGRTFTVAGLNAAANTFQLAGENSTTHTAYSSGGTVARTYARIDNAAGSDPNGHTVTIPIVAGASSYNVYKCFFQTVSGGSEFGFIGIARKIGSPASNTITFLDPGIAKDDFDTPPEDPDKFEVANEYPRTSTFYQQRLALGGANDTPTTIDFSLIGLPYNFTRSTPIQDDDAITAQLAGTNRILHVLDLGTSCAVFTAGGEWAILGGGEQGTLTPSDINARQFSYNGIGDLFPIVVNRTALYVQGRGGKVRDLLYDFASGGYDGTELSIKSAHLLDGFTIDDWAFQQNPHSIVWMARSDGKLLGLTYVRDQELIAWHRHDTKGEFERNCAVPEDTEDANYFIVKRTLIHPDSGATLTKRYIERMDSRQWTDVKDAKHLDCSITFDGRNTSTTNTVTYISASGWLQFANANPTGLAVGDQVQVRDASGNVVKFTIDASAAPPFTWSVTPDRTVLATISNVALLNWARAVNSVTGAWHLERESVGIFADGFVIGSPNNPSVTAFTVTNGALTLPAHFAVIHVGLPFISDLGTLAIDRVGNSLATKPKLITAADIWLHQTRGVWIGKAFPTGTDATEGLDEIKPRSVEGYDDPPDLITEVRDQSFDGAWSQDGKMALRVIDPVPVRILAISARGTVVS